MPPYIMYELKVTPDPPSPAPFPLSLSRRLSRLRLPADQSQALREAGYAADDLLSATASWYHPTNFFDAYPTIKKMHRLREKYAMATRTKNNKQTTYNRPDWKGFLERPMSDEELEHADEWKPKPLEIFELVHAVVEDGYDLSLSYNHNFKAATATIKDVRESRVTGGYALSAKDDTAPMALKLVLYKHFTLLEKDWSKLLDQPKRSKRG